jgi:hypothetical protein
MTFDNDEDRRKCFTEKLREKLQDPEFRKIERFPHGSDEDILNLSDPPYYTACPNPWIGDCIAHQEASRKNTPTAEFHSVMHKNEQSPIRVAYERRNRDLDPQLVWRGNVS